MLSTKCVDKFYTFDIYVEHVTNGNTNCNWRSKKKKGKNRQFEDKSWSSKLQHYWERPQYWEESWRLEETCCHSDSSEGLLVNIGGKTGNNNYNNNNKILLDFERLADHLILARRPGLVIINIKKRTSRIVDFVCSANNSMKIPPPQKKQLEMRQVLGPS